MYFQYNNRAFNFHALSLKNKLQKCIRKLCFSQWAFENSLVTTSLYVCHFYSSNTMFIPSLFHVTILKHFDWREWNICVYSKHGRVMNNRICINVSGKWKHLLLCWEKMFSNKKYCIINKHFSALNTEF